VASDVRQADRGESRLGHLIRMMPPRSGERTLPVSAVALASLASTFASHSDWGLAVAAVVWVVAVLIWIAIAFWPARVARRKGHSFVGFFIFSLVFFPAALITAYLVRPRRMIAPAGA
jgi:hypothetical protein